MVRHPPKATQGAFSTEKAPNSSAPVQPLLEVSSVSKSFGGVRALRDCTLSVQPGEVLGIVGHNGAGKSTLMNIIVGLIQRDQGEIIFDGTTAAAGISAAEAFGHGVRCVFQELSLCSNLDTIENTLLMHPALEGTGWRKRVEKIISAMLEEIFPDNMIPLNVPVEQLSIGMRQMIEIARAFVTTHKARPTMVILDEPTSSLGAVAAKQLMTHIQRVKADGVSSLLISHKLDEVITTSDRIVVMREGGVIAVRAKDAIEREDIFKLMGGDSIAATVGRTRSADVRDTRVEIELQDAQGNAADFKVHAGEVVGLAGLDGQGQKELLHRIYAAFKGQNDRSVKAAGNVAYVAGDRQREGVFPLWSIGGNISIGSMERLGRWLIPHDKERALTQRWFTNLGVRSPTMHMNIMTLSGGNQQKVLVARAFAAETSTILLNDPTRGVDVETKVEIYKRMRAAAAEDGKCIVWYSTENEEFRHCDRTYVFRDGRITDEIPSDDFSEARLVRSSFVSPTETAAT